MLKTTTAIFMTEEEFLKEEQHSSPAQRICCRKQPLGTDDANEHKHDSNRNASDNDNQNCGTE